jgi:rubrerythrin
MGMMLSSEEVFSLAMEIEKSGHAYYSTIADSAEFANVSELFTFLAEQEIAHYRYFEKLKETAPELVVDAEEWEQTSEYIRATTESRFFIGKDRAIQLAKSATTAIEAVDYAIGFEKDTLLYFFELHNVSPPESKKSAMEIVEEEKRHVKMLSKKREELVAGQ